MRALRYRVYQLLEKAEEGDRASRLVDVGLFILVSVNVLAVSLETVDSLHPMKTYFGGLKLFLLPYLRLNMVCVYGPLPLLQMNVEYHLLKRGCLMFLALQA